MKILYYAIMYLITGFQDQYCTLPQIAGLLGLQEFNADEVSGKLESILPVIQKVNEQFKNPVSVYCLHLH